MKEGPAMKRIFIMFAMIIPITSIFACINGNGYLPKNDLNIPEFSATSTVKSGITQQEFNSVIDKIESIYGSIINGYGGNLQVERLWSDGTVNAMASRQGNTYLVKMFGGLARHQAITKDGFALVACHEVGHHIGGVPRYTEQAGGSWASTEGQSDYFATTKCLRKLFRNDNNIEIVANMQIDPVASTKCESQFSDPNEIAICKRIAMAGFSGSSLFANMGGNSLPRFDQPDSNIVNRTYESHPAYQCRLDTYYQGAICTVADSVEIGQSNPDVGTCNRTEQFTEGLRPLCWFKPRGSGSGGDTGGGDPPVGNIAATPTVNGQTSILVTNPNLMLRIFVDVRNFRNVTQVAVEFSKPNRQFSNPNGNSPDSTNSLRVEVHPNTSGNYQLIPARHLPGWGVYQMRVIGLDAQRNPVSRFSNSLQINLRQSLFYNPNTAFFSDVVIDPTSKNGKFVSK